jgi:exodeoxyribonuclease-5
MLDGQDFELVNQSIRGKPPGSVITLPRTAFIQTEEDELRDVERQMGARFTANCLSEEQRTAFEKIVEWVEFCINDHHDILTLGGFAGTGKTTLLCALADYFEDKRIAFCSLTGKAVSVLKQKFIAQNVRSGNHSISTIHSLLYDPITGKGGAIIGWKKKDTLDYDLIVVDEGSMVNQEILRDFMEFEVPLLAVGDHGQLPPIEGSFNLMGDPELRLEHIHRQAEGSPVLALSQVIRDTGKFPPVYANTPEVQFLAKAQAGEVLQSLYNTPGFKLDDLALLCFKNKTRTMLNKLARSIRWGKAPELPMIGDQVICLKNSYDGLFNGMRGEFTDIKQTSDVHLMSTVIFPSELVRFDGAVNRHQFGRDKTFKDLIEFSNISGYRAYSWLQLGLLADYGFAITVHKSQGSEFPYVIFYDDYDPNHHGDADPADFYKRLIYTAVSRCRKFLVVLR